MDKLKESIDPYYNRLDNAVKNFKDKSRVISADSRLSKVGKSEKLSELTQKHSSDIDSLAERFQAEFGKRLVNLDNRVNGVLQNTALDEIKSMLKKGESLTSDQQNRLIIHELAENKRLMSKSSFQNMLSNSDIEQLRKTAQSLNDSQDVDRLEWLRELVDLKGEATLTSSLEAQINGIKTSKLTDEQKQWKKVSERISKQMQLFDYALQRGKTGEFMDVRQSEISSGD